MKLTKMSRESLNTLVNRIHELMPNNGPAIKLMEVCGTHTMAIGKSGLRQLMPQNVKLISGPGCPVCVTHQGEIDNYLKLAERDNVIITTFGDLIRVPGSSPGKSLQHYKSQGSDIRVVYSTLDAIKLAQEHPGKEVVFLGVGFETTAPTVAHSIIEAKESKLQNYSVYSMHKVIPPALKALLADQEVEIDGFIAPGHVSSIIGIKPYQFVANDYGKPCVLTGFDPLDILEGIVMLLEQINSKKAEVTIQYKRGVSVGGNPVAQGIINKVFTRADAWWRGIGCIPESGLSLREEFRDFDALKKFNLPSPQEACQGQGEVNQLCQCGQILKGIKLPQDCPAFKKICNPAHPLGPCMVSTEGSCAAYYRYGTLD